MNKQIFAVLLACCCTVHGQIGARVCATQQNIIDACNTSHVKLVFACQGSLWFVDFSESPPQIRKMNGVASAWFPVISGDGGRVTYQTGVEAEGASLSTVSGKVWLRELAVDGTPLKITDTGYVPRFVQNTPPDSPEIVYATSVACPSKICYNAGQTVKSRVLGASVLPPQVITAAGSYYGGLSWDNRYLVTGWPAGPNLFMLDLTSGSGPPKPVHTMRVRKSGTNADTFVSIGACNMSRSSSRIFTNTTLYYDFGSAAIMSAKCIHPLLGMWGEHQKLFISRFDSEDLRVFGTPADRPLTPIAAAQGKGEAIGREWFYPEWSTHPYFAAASLYIKRRWLQKDSTWKDSYNGELIYLVNLKDSAYVRLVESTDTSAASTVHFGYPFLWVEVPPGFTEDSTWLSRTIWERAGIGVRPRASALIDRSATRGRAAAVYSLNGRRLTLVNGNPRNAARALNLGRVGSGVYLFVREESNGRRTIRPVVY